MAQPLLEGRIDNRDDTIQNLRDQLRDAQEDVKNLQRLLDQARGDNRRAIAGLRQTLSPLYQALQVAFGDMDAIDGGPVPMGGPVSPSTPSNAQNRAWEAWKLKLGGKTAECIQAFLDHGPMSRDQIRIAMQCGWSTLDLVLKKLNDAHLLVKPTGHGGKYSLKEL